MSNDRAEAQSHHSDPLGIDSGRGAEPLRYRRDVRSRLIVRPKRAFVRAGIEAEIAHSAREPAHMIGELHHRRRYTATGQICREAVKLAVNEAEAALSKRMGDD